MPRNSGFLVSSPPFSSFCTWERRDEVQTQLYSIVNQTWMVYQCLLNLSPTTILLFFCRSAKPNYLIFPKYSLWFSDYTFSSAITCTWNVLFFFSFANPSFPQGSSETSSPRNLSCDLQLFWTPRVTMFLLNYLPYYYHHYKLFKQREYDLYDGMMKNPGICGQRICWNPHCSLTNCFRLGTSFSLLP